METTEFAARDILKMSGLTYPTLDRWLTTNNIKTDTTTQGNGDGHRVFNRVEATAIVYAANCKAASASQNWCNDAITCIANMTEEEIQEAIAENRTFHHVGANKFLDPGEPHENATERQRAAFVLMNLATAYYKVLGYSRANFGK